MSHIFISYARKDEVFTDKIVEALKAKGLKIWIDRENLYPRSRFETEIFRAIEEADAFIFLFSPSSALSKMCQQEIGHAAAHNKRIIVVRVLETGKIGLPPPLSPHINWIECKEGKDDFYTAINKIWDGIYKDYEWIKYQARLEVKALDWERTSDTDRLLRGKELQEAEEYLADTSKDPPVTELQRAFVGESRSVENEEQSKIAEQRQKTNLRLRRLAISLGGFIICAVTAICVSVLSISQILPALRTRQQAQLNELARELAANAQYKYTTGYPNPTITTLLAIQSMKMVPSVEASQILQDKTLSRTISYVAFDDCSNSDVVPVTFIQDGKYVAAGCDGSFRVWEPFTGKKITSINTTVGAVIFSADNKYAMTANSQMIDIWELMSGKAVTRLSHDGVISNVSFGPYGKYVAAAGDGITVVWDTVSGKEIARKTIPNNFFDTVAFSPDGKSILTLNEFGNPIIWNFITGNQVTSLEGPYNPSLFVFSPDGKYIASNGVLHNDNDKILQLWDTATGKEIIQLVPNAGMEAFAFSQDSKLLVLGGLGRIVYVWDIASGEEIGRMEHGGDIQAVAFSPDGRYLVSGDNNRALVWEITTGKKIAQVVYDSYVTSVAFSPDGRYVVSGSRDNIATVWAITASTESMLAMHDAGVTSVAISPDGKYVASGSEDNSVGVWKVSTGNEATRMVHEDSVTSVAFSPDGRYVASGSRDSTARVWEAATGKEIAHMTHQDTVTLVAFSPNGKYVLSGSCDHNARVWNATTGREISRMSHDGCITSAAFSSDGKYVVSGSADISENQFTNSTVRVWVTITGEEISRITSDGFVNSVDFSPDGRYVVSGQSGETAHVSEASTGTWVGGLTLDQRVNSVDFSPDGKYAALGSEDNTARVWEATTREEIARFTQTAAATLVKFSPDGKYVVSADENIAHIWEAVTGVEIDRIAHENRITSITFSLDGKYLVTGSEDKTVRVWLWRPQDLINDACSRITRNLTRAEWDQYIGDALPYQAICSNFPIEPRPIQ